MGEVMGGPDHLKSSFTMSKPRDYSSRTYSPGSAGPVKSQPINKLDSSGKNKEKKEMVSLNDKFVQLIDKVKNLENEKRKLTTKLSILKQQEDYTGKVDELVKQQENLLEQQIESLLSDQEKLKDELLRNQEEVEDTKKRYEDELLKKAELENDFVVTKKVVDEGHLDAVELALDLEDLMRKLEFLRAGYDEEIKELESQVQNVNLVLPGNDKRSLDMEQIVKSIEVQYANMAARTRDEAEQWNQRKMDAMVFSAGQREQEVRDIRREISDTLRQIQRLNADLDSLKRKQDSLNKDIEDARQEGDENITKARDHIAQLEDALRRARQDLAQQIRDHQELLNLKLALDIEIATYRQLLVGEEQRIGDVLRHAGGHRDVHLPSKLHHPEKPRAAEPSVTPETSTLPPDSSTISPLFPDSKKRLLIRVEVMAGRVVSESSHYAE